MARGHAIIFSGASGTGKTSLTRRLLAADRDLILSISTTSRDPRGQERDGVDYHFIERGEFLDRVRAGRFFEWAEVHGNLYGSDRHWVEEQLASGKDVLFDIDVQGGHKLKDRLPDARLVLILPPSWEELERRLRGRGTDSDEVIERRMAAAKQEMKSASDYEEIIVNEDLASAVAQAESLIRLLRRTTDGRSHLQALVSA